MRTQRIVLPLILLALAGCAVVPPSGPTVLALPPQGKDLQRFQGEDAWCRNFAAGQIGYGAAAQAGSQAAVGSAVAGTAIGAATGALIGSAGGAAGAGAAVGAGTGLVAGSAIGANTASLSSAGLQSRYDGAYAQCMTSAGNTLQTPAYGGVPYGYAYPYAYPYYSPYYGPYAYWPYYWGPSISLGFYGGHYGYGGRGYWGGPRYYGHPYRWHR
jgi:hypothetical protein